MPDPISQASFIPKKSLGPSPTAQKKKTSINLFMVIAVLLFLVSLGLGVAVYFYNTSQQQILSQKQAELRQVKDFFDKSVVAQLASLDARMKSAEEILAGHTIFTPFYSALSEATLQTVRFTNFQYQSIAGSQINVIMGGEAESFTSIALQSDSFIESEAFGAPLFSNFSIQEDGSVTFNVTLPINPTLLLYSANFK